jgi:hypothetical protein
MSLRHRDDLTAAVRRRLKGFPEDRDLASFVEHTHLSDSALAMHRDDLWGVTSAVLAMQAQFDLVVTRSMPRRQPPGKSGTGADPLSPSTPFDHRAHPLWQVRQIAQLTAPGASDAAHASLHLWLSTEGPRSAVASGCVVTSQQQGLYRRRLLP